MEAHEKMEVRTLVACVLRHFDRFKVSDGEEDVLDVPLGVAVLAHHLLGALQHLVGLLCESVLSHHLVTLKC